MNSIGRVFAIEEQATDERVTACRKRWGWIKRNSSLRNEGDRHDVLKASLPQCWWSENGNSWEFIACLNVKHVFKRLKRTLSLVWTIVNIMECTVDSILELSDKIHSVLLRFSRRNSLCRQTLQHSSFIRAKKSIAVYYNTKYRLWSSGGIDETKWRCVEKRKEYLK